MQRFSWSWMIPKEAQKPADLRKNRKGRLDIAYGIYYVGGADRRLRKMARK